ncbi:MAG: DNA ligase (EC, partial [uncultured Campylobacterales bacterium]
NISRVTLHNFDEILKKDLRIHDKVIIIRSGDVIPKIIKPIKEYRSGLEVIITPPTKCPDCNTKLYYEDVLIKCHNLECPSVVINSIIHFVSKKGINCDGFGKKIVALLYNEGLIKNILDIFHLKYEDLMALESFKEKKSINLIDSINNTKNKTTLKSFINSLSINNIGEVASEKIADKFGLDFINASEEELIQIDGFADILAKSFVQFISINKDLIQKLLQIINPIIPEIKNINNIFTGKTIVLTGSMKRPRDEIKQELLSFKAKVTSSISKKTDFLIYGEKAGSKLEKANSLGVTTINEEEYQRLTYHS